MRKLIAMVIRSAASILLAISVVGVARAEAPSTQCDVEASHTADIAPLAPPVEWSNLDGYRALGACLQALAQYPTSGRLMALIARAYSKLEDNDNTFKWAQAAASTGSTLGMYQLGLSYDFGQGVAKDPAMAMMYMRKVAAAGFPAAVHNIGVYHLKGDGVPRSADEAIAYFERAASMGYPRSFIAIGEIWEKGEKGSRTMEDLQRARDYYARARDRGVNIGDAFARLDTAIASAPSAPSGSASASSPDSSSQGKSSLPNGFRWMQVASRQSLDEAIVVAREHGAKFPGVSIFRTQNGWFAIVIGAIQSTQAADMIELYVGRGWIPADSVSTRGESFGAKVWPLGEKASAPAPAPAPTVGVAKTAPVKDLAPVKSAAPAGRMKWVSIPQSALRAFSPDTHWISLGAFIEFDQAIAKARAFGDLPIYQTRGGLYIIVVANGPSDKLEALFSRMRSNGELPENAAIVDGQNFVRPVFAKTS